MKPWRSWRGYPRACTIIDSRLKKCLVCGEQKETLMATVHGYQETGQSTPFLKINVCKTCLEGADKE